MQYPHDIFGNLTKEKSAKTIQDVADTLIHCWFRLVVSSSLQTGGSERSSHPRRMNNNAAEIKTARKVTTEEEDEAHILDNHTTVENKIKEDWILPLPTSSFVHSSYKQLINFVEGYGTDYIFRRAAGTGQVLSHLSKVEECYIQSLLRIGGTDDGTHYEDFCESNDASWQQNDLENTKDHHEDLREPFIAFVQCRRGIDVVESGEEGYAFFNQTLHSYHEFDVLSEMYLWRRDVAFFVVIPDEEDECCSSWIGHSCEEDRETGIGKGDTNNNKMNGYVRALRLFPSTDLNKEENQVSRSRWKGLYEEDLHNDSSIHSPFYSTGPFIANDVPSYDQVNLTQFVVIQTTPSVLWFDRYTSAALAFPLYRKIHLMLFVDMHTIRSIDNSISNSSDALAAHSRTRHAVTLMKRTALNRSNIYPKEDVVFLVIPSTETRILTTFGIDIWRPLDLACNDIRQSQKSRPCSANVPMLPMALITSRKESRNSMMRYYLQSKDLVAGMISNSASNSNEEHNDSGTISTFLLNYFKGKLSHTIKSEALPFNRTNDSGVQIVTGDTFQKLVMEKNNMHTIVEFSTPTCGHCKRFSIVWNELGNLVQSLNWNSVIDVMKMDVTKNEVYHDQLDLQNVPAVYYFPAGSKDAPIELIIEGDKELRESNVGGISNVTSIIEWMIQRNELDEKELLNLAQNSARIK